MLGVLGVWPAFVWHWELRHVVHLSSAPGGSAGRWMLGEGHTLEPAAPTISVWLCTRGHTCTTTLWDQTQQPVPTFVLTAFRRFHKFKPEPLKCSTTTTRNDSSVHVKIADITLSSFELIPPPSSFSSPSHLLCHPFLEAVVFALSWFYGGFLAVVKCRASSPAAQPPGAIIQLFRQNQKPPAAWAPSRVMYLCMWRGSVW